MKLQHNNFEDERTRHFIESQLTLVASVGLADPMRENISVAFSTLNEGATNVRLISGDHKMSAMLAAVKMGIFDGLDHE